MLHIYSLPPPHPLSIRGNPPLQISADGAEVHRLAQEYLERAGIPEELRALFTPKHGREMCVAVLRVRPLVHAAYKIFFPAACAVVTTSSPHIPRTNRPPPPPPLYTAGRATMASSPT